MPPHVPNVLVVLGSYPRGKGQEKGVQKCGGAMCRVSNRVSGSTDAAVRGEMTAFHSANKFWVIIGSNLNETADNESYGISNIEIWVR